VRGERDTPSLGTSSFWAYAVIVMHVLFVISWLVAPLWQESGYSVIKHSISDMYAVGAPHPYILIVVITLSGVAMLGFVIRSVWPAFRSAGWLGKLGAVLLALSIFGLGDLLTPLEREGCPLAAPGCTSADQTANHGGQLDETMSNFGLLAFIAAGLVLSLAMRRIEAFRRFAHYGYWVTFVNLVTFVAIIPAGDDGEGITERLAAVAGVCGIILLAAMILRESPGPSPAEAS
jgi:hypothetical membrane protein